MTTKTSVVYLVVLIFSWLCFSLPQFAFAQIVINEFLPDVPSDQDENQDEWVELYNTGENPINIEGYLLLDAKDNQLIISSDHTQTLNLDPKAFAVIKRNGSSFSLNNSTDTIKLYVSTQSAQPVDEISYDQVKTNKSWGRHPDGTGSWQANQEPTPGSGNQATPSPTAQPTATPTPKPTQTSSSNQDQQVNNPPTSSPKPTSPSAKKPSPTQKPQKHIGKVKGITSLTATASPQIQAASASSDIKLNKKSNNLSSLVFILSGLAFLSAASLHYYKTQRLDKIDL